MLPTPQQLCKAQGFDEDSEIFAQCLAMMNSTDGGIAPTPPPTTPRELCKDQGFGENSEMLAQCLAAMNASNDDIPRPDSFTISSHDSDLQMGCHYHDDTHSFKVFIMVNFTVMFLLPLAVSSSG